MQFQMPRNLRIPVVLTVLMPLAVVRGQESSSPARQHVVLPPAFASTPLSLQIQAQAQYLAARGDLLQSAAVARNVNADAVAKEIQNSIDYVGAYLRRRDVNREWRAKENPDYLAAEGKRQVVRKQRLESQLQDVLKGDVTEELNWLLAELSGPILAYQYLQGRPALVDTELNPKLPADAVSMLWFSDGGLGPGSLVFAASDPKVLQTPWPLALRDPCFAMPRSRFESSRDKLVQSLRDRQDAAGREKEVVRCVEDLLTVLQKAYPDERRDDPSEFLAYHSAQRFLRSLAAQVHRALEAADPSILDGSLRFQGERLLDLVQHMDRNGLIFAPSQPGGERVYRSLLGDLRNVWLTLATDRPSSGNTNSLTQVK